MSKLKEFYLGAVKKAKQALQGDGQMSAEAYAKLAATYVDTRDKVKGRVTKRKAGGSTKQNA